MYMCRGHPAASTRWLNADAPIQLEHGGAVIGSLRMKVSHTLWLIARPSNNLLAASLLHSPVLAVTGPLQDSQWCTLHLTNITNAAVQSLTDGCRCDGPIAFPQQLQPWSSKASEEKPTVCRCFWSLSQICWARMTLPSLASLSQATCCSAQSLLSQRPHRASRPSQPPSPAARCA